MRFVAACCRAGLTTFCLGTSAYAFLVSVPFVHEQFLQPELVPALARFARWHGALSLFLAPLAAGALWPDRRHRAVMTTGPVLVWLLAMLGVAAAASSPLERLTPGAWALVLSGAALVPVAWLAVVDLALASRNTSAVSEDPIGHDAAVAAAAAALATSLSWLAAAIVPAAGAMPAAGVVQSVTAHAVLFAGLFAAVTMVRALSELGPTAARWRAIGALVLYASLLGVATARIVLTAVSQRAIGSRAAAFAFGAVLGLVLGARGLRRGAVDGDHDDGSDDVRLVFAGALPSWARSATIARRVGWGIALVGLAVAVRAGSMAMDWNFAVAKLGAVMLWVLALATCAAWVPARVPMPAPVPFALSLALLAAHLVAAGRVPWGPVTVEAAAGAGDAWAVHDAGFRALRDWLRPPTPDAAAPPADGEPGGVAFFDYLQANTNIGRSIEVAPVPVRLADLESTPATGRPPNVFVFAIDSLRRDYLAPYNPAVTFTPAIQRFAADSTVFEKAFTRYGATGLSVPSMWVGGMILHKQYVTPFAPMNALHALLRRHGYARWMSMDNIVNVIMPRDDSLDELDRGRDVADFRLCPSLDDLRGRLDRLGPDGPPAFVWTLPQDVHVAVVGREGKTSLDGEAYPGFYAPVASRVRRLDGCFGQFLDDLRGRNLYDESVIVLTSDHGDSLGEGGRWGHAYTLFPEVVQVPLIVHLPASIRGTVESAPASRVFTSDITPTLYALLGHEVTPPASIFGRPLVWRKGSAPPPGDTFGLMASSYGSVYGWLDDTGDRLYVADGVELRDYAFTLDGSAAGVPAPVTAEIRATGQRAIRAGVGAIAAFYRYP
ncbi:MAG: sulfatase-like hydrolase/transferase [Vicinamibacterales bacterium]